MKRVDDTVGLRYLTLVILTQALHGTIVRKILCHLSYCDFHGNAIIIRVHSGLDRSLGQFAWCLSKLNLVE